MISNGFDQLQRGRWIAFTLLFLWAVLILVLGSSQGSMGQTSRFIRPLLEFFFPNASPDTFLLFHSFIRKAAHFIEYFIFSLLAVRAFSYVQHTFVQKWRYILALLAAFALAVVDETVQSFNELRTGTVLDVLIDVSGAAIAAFIYRISIGRRNREAREGSLADEAGR